MGVSQGGRVCVHVCVHPCTHVCVPGQLCVWYVSQDGPVYVCLSLPAYPSALQCPPRWEAPAARCGLPVLLPAVGAAHGQGPGSLRLPPAAQQSISRLSEGPVLWFFSIQKLSLPRVRDLDAEGSTGRGEGQPTPRACSPCLRGPQSPLPVCAPVAPVSKGQSPLCVCAPGHRGGFSLPFLQRWGCASSTVSVLLSWLGMTQGWHHSFPRRPPGLLIPPSGCSAPLRSLSASWVPLNGHFLSFPTIFLP